MAISLGKRVHEALTKFISDEFGVSYTYFSMYILLKDMGLAGCAAWVLVRSQEKIVNTVELCDYICYRGAKVRFQPLPAPKQDWRAPLHIFEEMMRLEQKGASVLAVIYESAIADKDYPSQNFLLELIVKQTKREMSLIKILERLRRMQSTDIGVLTFDSELRQMALEKLTDS
jgi:ferritin